MEVVALAYTDPQRLRVTGERFGVRRGHADVAVAALEAGKLRFHRRVRQAGEALTSGRLGRVCLIQSAFTAASPFRQDAPAWRTRRVLYDGGDHRVSYKAQWRHFALAASGEAPVEVPLSECRRAVAVQLAALSSAEAGRPVRVSDVGTAPGPAGNQ